ncbi:MAG: RraA family protein [Actinomycetota bacterium]
MDAYPWEISPEELAGRYLRLHTPAVCDVLDGLGLFHQALPPEIQPLSREMKLAGPAFTAKGAATTYFTEDDVQFAFQGWSKALGMPGPIGVVEASGDRTAAHWGELLSNASKALGGKGVVVDGGVRDVDRILPIGFPVFAKFNIPTDIRGRWRYVDFAVPVRVGNVIVSPWDYILGDINGVVVIPKELVEEVLVTAEPILERENLIRAELTAGANPMEVYAKYGSF